MLVASLMLTLIGRLYYVQILDKHKPVQTAGLLHQGASSCLRRAARSSMRVDARSSAIG